ncbi:MAG: FtsQ-type POTRA domain-containing protein [Actinomycetaceae bacterium]|nr:FtsQ-type POTRA domain-containing protein [Actinomycetaceae bacterium]
MRPPRRPRKPASLTGGPGGSGRAERRPGSPSGRGKERAADGGDSGGRDARGGETDGRAQRARSGRADAHPAREPRAESRGAPDRPSMDSFEKARRERARQLRERAASRASAPRAERGEEKPAGRASTPRGERGEVTKRGVTVVGAGPSGADAALLVEEVSGGGGHSSRGDSSRGERARAPIEMSQRRAERQAERRRVTRRRAIIAALCVVVAACLTWVAAFSPLLAFRAGRVEVSGADGTLVKAEQVERALNGYTGTPLLRLNTGAAQRAIEKANPLVKEAKVSRSFPSGLNVELKVRQPVACLDEDGSCQAIDADGVRIDVPDEIASELPTLNLRTDNAAEATKSMVTVLAALDARTRSRIASVSVSPTGQVSFSLEDGASVVWGRPEDNAKKAKVLSSLLDQGASGYDVSAPNAPVANPGGEANVSESP